MESVDRMLRRDKQNNKPGCADQKNESEAAFECECWILEIFYGVVTVMLVVLF